MYLHCTCTVFIQQSKAPHRDHFVRPSVCTSVCLSIRLSRFAFAGTTCLSRNTDVFYVNNKQCWTVDKYCLLMDENCLLMDENCLLFLRDKYCLNWFSKDILLLCDHDQILGMLQNCHRYTHTCTSNVTYATTYVHVQYRQIQIIVDYHE